MKFNKLISISLLVALSVTGAMAQDHYLTSVAAYTDSYLSLEDGSETVYLPAGTWEPYEGGRRIESAGEWITAPAPLDKMPVFRRI